MYKNIFCSLKYIAFFKHLRYNNIIVKQNLKQEANTMDTVPGRRTEQLHNTQGERVFFA